MDLPRTLLPLPYPVPRAVCGTSPLPWGGFGVSCPPCWHPRRAPAVKHGQGRLLSWLPKPTPALPGGLWPPQCPTQLVPTLRWTLGHWDPSVLQAGAFGSVRGFGVPACWGGLLQLLGCSGDGTRNLNEIYPIDPCLGSSADGS